MTKGKYTKAQEAFVELTGIRKGSLVKIIAKAYEGQYGWNAGWDYKMDALVNDGKEYRVIDVNAIHGVYIMDSRKKCWYYPFFCVEVMKYIPVSISLESGDYNATINNDGSITVGCQKISYEKLDEIHTAATKAKKSNS